MGKNKKFLGTFLLWMPGMIFAILAAINSPGAFNKCWLGSYGVDIVVAVIGILFMVIGLLLLASDK